jgi:hypothetical protein
MVDSKRSGQKASQCTMSLMAVTQRHFADAFVLQLGA